MSSYPGGFDSLPINWIDYGNPGSQLVTAAFLNRLGDALNKLERAAQNANVVAAAPIGVAATDRANLIQAIGDTPEGGKLWLPAGADGATPYLVDQAITISKHITIEGASKVEKFTSIASGGTPNGPATPFLLGVEIRQVTAATDVLQLSGAAKQVNLRNIGIGFDAAIRHTNTGHGINATPPVRGSGHDIGLASSLWENVTVYGHDGNHYGFYLLNLLYVTLTHWHTYGGGGLLIECDSFDTNMGNFVSIHSYVDVFNSGTAHAHALKSRTARTAANGHLNLLTFIRPQVNITGAAATAATQALWKSNAGAANPSRVEIISPDFEYTGGAGPPFDTGGPASGTILRKGGLLNALPTGGADQDIGYQSWTAAGTYTFVIPDGVTRVRVRCVGSGGGGGGGGTNAAAAANTGGGGGGAGVVTDAWQAVTPYQSYTVTVGAGGTSGGGGSSGGAVGVAGGAGNQSSFGGNLKANGGGGGAGGPASATTSAAGGNYGRAGTVGTVGIPGAGGVSASPNGNSSFVMPPGVVGGAAGGASSTTLGGGGGGAMTGAFPAYTAQGGGSQGTSATAAGVAGTTATTPGSGGGGGGGAPSGGAGGAGGAGADGMVEVWW